MDDGINVRVYEDCKRKRRGDIEWRGRGDEGGEVDVGDKEDEWAAAVVIVRA